MQRRSLITGALASLAGLFGIKPEKGMTIGELNSDAADFLKIRMWIQHKDWSILSKVLASSDCIGTAYATESEGSDYPLEVNICLPCKGYDPRKLLEQIEGLKLGPLTYWYAA